MQIFFRAGRLSSELIPGQPWRALHFLLQSVILLRKFEIQCLREELGLRKVSIFNSFEFHSPGTVEHNVGVYGQIMLLRLREHVALLGGLR